jgi:hypothetical protein
MVNLTLEDDFIPFRKTRSLLVFIRVYPCVSVADFFLLYQSPVA